MSNDQTCPVRDELHQAGNELKHAADKFTDAIIGEGTRDHLRNAARHVLKAGIAALDKAEKKMAPEAASSAAVIITPAPTAG